MKNQNLFFRDLKPENLLLESKKEGSPIKVIDFGTSRQFNPSIKMNQKFGTILYMAPEVLKGRYDQKCDIWSCGVICYILLCGYPPFNDRVDTAIIEKIKKADLVFPPEEWNQVSLEAKDFVRKLLNPDPDSRLSASEALKHTWILKRRKTESLSNPNSLKALNNLKTFRADRKIQQGPFKRINKF
jgi:calcium-dependent protein kinase